MLSRKEQLLRKYANYVERQEPWRKENHLLDTYLVEAILLNPHDHPRAYSRMVEKEMGHNRFRYDILRVLRHNRLDHPEKRGDWVREIQKTALLAFDFFRQNTTGQEKGRLYERLLQRVLKVPYGRKSMMESKAILIGMIKIGSLSEELSEKLPDIVNLLDFKSIEFFLRGLIEEYAYEYGLRKKKSLEESLDELTSFLSTPVQPQCETTDLQGQNEFLKQENEDLRSGLTITTQELEEFRNSLEQFREEEKSLTVSDFFQSLNNGQYGYLLDQFAACEKQLLLLRGKGYQFPEEVESIPLTIRMFMRYLKEFGISPIETEVTEKSVTLDECQNYDYSGSPFSTPKETKNVRFLSSGWQKGNLLISKPRVEEIESV